MQWIETIKDYVENFGIYRVTIDLWGYLEILILAFLVYYIMVWMKTTRAWQLMKGLVVICLFLVVAYLLEMNTIIWIAKNVLSFSAIAIIVVVQPELRHALEELGKKNFLPVGFFSDSVKKEREMLTEKNVDEIVRACYEMGNAKTGALIVIEQKESLKEFEKTGIEIDAIISSQLLINIFEHNTPLHDGAVIIRGNRVAAATCYLHLTTDLSLSKALGTRHRAAVGVSEETDSLTIIVSEETGAVSMAYEGKLFRNVEPKVLKKKINAILNRVKDEETSSKTVWKEKTKTIMKGIGKAKNEKEDTQ